MIKYSDRSVPAAPSAQAVPPLRPGDDKIVEYMRSLLADRCRRRCSRARWPTAVARRPVWSFAAMHEAVAARYKVFSRTVRRLVYSVAYQFAGGPWRLALVRFGYDPRKVGTRHVSLVPTDDAQDAESRRYQVIDLRLKGLVDKQARREKVVSMPLRGDVAVSVKVPRVVTASDAAADADTARRT